MKRLRAAAALVLAAALPVLPAAAPAAAVSAQAALGGAAPVLETSTTSSDTGFWRLSWSSPGDVELQEATRADFSDARVLYEGPDQATVVSGRLDGVYHYRLRAAGGPWGQAVRVEVQHHSLRKALSFLGAGAVVFVSTVILIVVGHRRHRREFPGGAVA